MVITPVVVASIGHDRKKESVRSLDGMGRIVGGVVGRGGGEGKGGIKFGRWAP